MKNLPYVLLLFLGWSQAGFQALAQAPQAQNPVIHADVPDLSMIRVGDTYYMSSTTMHLSPGLPIMKSQDLTNWELVNYAYETLDTLDALTLSHGQNAYGRGSWASCLRYHQGTFYVSTFSQTTGKTYIYSTQDLEKGPFKVSAFAPAYHDHTLHVADDGRIYLIWGAGTLRMVELKADLSGAKAGTERVLIENASAPAEGDIMLPAEGSQLFQVEGRYYLFNIVWPQGGMRSVLIHRADSLTGPYEGRLALQDKGVAQGGLIDTPDGRWFAYLFRDVGAVGRIPYLVPVTWESGWPVLGEAGKVPLELPLPPSRGPMPGIVASDDFSRQENEPDLPLVWQWNHNPDPDLWSVHAREGFLRLRTGRVVPEVLSARNTLTQRTFGPWSAVTTAIDLSGMQEGDVAGLMLLQKKYGWIGVEMKEGKKSLLMVHAGKDGPETAAQLPLTQQTVFLKAVADFRDHRDLGTFFYSLDGQVWEKLGHELQMAYTLPHFMGYRFGLFNYATQSPGGYVDIDFFRFQEK